MNLLGPSSFSTTVVFLLCILVMHCNMSPILPDTSSSSGLSSETPDPGDVFIPLASCGTDKDILLIDQLQVNPDPPKTGQMLFLNATGRVQATIPEGSKVHVLVKYRFLTLLDQVMDLCELAKSTGLSCPIEEGEHALVTSVMIPSIAPKVTLWLKTDLYTPDNTPIACINGNLKLD